MAIEFDPEKRAATLIERGLDMAEAGAIFEGPTLTAPDNRRDYGEERCRTIGWLGGRMVAVAWTPRGAVRRIISLRCCNERERTRYLPAVSG